MEAYHDQARCTGWSVQAATDTVLMKVHTSTVNRYITEVVFHSINGSGGE